MEKFTAQHAKLLYSRFSAIFGDKFVKSIHDDGFKCIWCEEWCNGLLNIDVSLIKKALDYCRTNLIWPPSIAEFRMLCEQSSGIPTLEQSFRAAIRQEFTHPIISAAYEEVGSWSMQRDKELELKIKFGNAYANSLNSFRTDPASMLAHLKDLKERKALPAPLSKIPTKQERISFQQRYAEWKKAAEDQKQKPSDKEHPVWDKNSITPRHSQFDKDIFEERKNYLLDLSEKDAFSLSMDDKYDRIRFFRELDASRRVESIKQYHDKASEEKIQPRPCNSARTVYKNWMND